MNVNTKRTVALAVALLSLFVLMRASVSAQEVSESAETVVLYTPESLSEEIPEEIAEADKDELLKIINGLSGEGVERVRAAITVGIDSVERGGGGFWDRAAGFCERHIEAVSLLAFALCVLFYVFVRLRSTKKLRGDIRVSTNNAVETVEIAKRISADSTSALERAAASIDTFGASLEEALAEMRGLMETEQKKSAECESLRMALKHNADADMLVADTVNELLQLANIPQNKKDAIYTRITSAKAIINAEREGGEESDGKRGS